MGHILSLLSNHVGDANALFICSEEESKWPMPAQYFKYIFELLHQKDVEDYIGLMSSEEQLDLFYHMAGRLDRFQSSFAKACGEFNTNAAIAAGKADDIDFAAYQKATITLSDDLTALVKAANG